MSIRITSIRRAFICRDKTVFIGERTLIMGILNVTPDSFSDGGQYDRFDKAVQQARKMADEGADFIDIGGESTRPGATEVDAEEEQKRVLPVVEQLVQELDVPISVDTYKAPVAEAALKKGAHLINDVWGFRRDPEIANVAADFNAPVILMHNQKGTVYEMDIMEAIKHFLEKSVEIGLKAGIKENQIMIDPGIGFGKTPEQNIQVMARLDELRPMGFPILLGTSRKSMIGKILDLPTDQRLEGTLATTAIGIISGVAVIRVHDVQENVRAALVADAIVRGYTPWIR